MQTLISLELLKLKRRHFFLPICLFLGVGLVWCTIIAIKEFNFNESYRNVLVLINDLVIINSMIFPLLIGVMCSRLIDIEHQGKMFRLLQTNNQSIETLFLAKSLVGMLIIVVLGIVQVLYLIGLSIANRLSFEWGPVLLFLLSYLVASIFLVMLHLAISLFIEKQSIGIILALGASFIGLVSGGMLPKVLQLFLPWQYYALLNPVSRTIVNNGYVYSNNSQYSFLMVVIVLLVIGEMVLIRKKAKVMEFC
ncbi:ABC transporter permease [Vagococcus sp. BWB3-3]|uniref:ABC transporter permease n=1 Tax=Vagococcus allomyrinae TaxID=2794353 RepID=A0A940SXK3_9ENTE|nr:ABC transporter permease [Vagococcus allomyrinae]